jgi:hypothetical protein
LSLEIPDPDGAELLDERHRDRMGRQDQQGGSNERVSRLPDVASAPAVGPGKQTAAEGTAGAPVINGEQATPEPSPGGEAAIRAGPWEPDESFLRAAGMLEPSGVGATGPARLGSRASGARSQPPVAATKIAAANSRKLAASIDALRALDDAALVQRRAEAQAQVAQPRLADAERERLTREHDAVEFVCAERGLAMQVEARERRPDGRALAGEAAGDAGVHRAPDLDVGFVWRRPAAGDDDAEQRADPGELCDAPARP